MKLKRFLATVLSTVVIFNTVSEPLLSYAAESTDKSKSKKEFEKMIYEDGVTFDEYANALLDDQGLYQHCGTVYFYANWVKQHQLAFDTQGGNIKPDIIRNGVYRIQYSGDSSKAIHLVNKSYTTGVATNIWTGTGSAFNTNWYFERYKDTDYYYIMNAGNSLYLKSSGTHNGTPSLQRLTSTTSNKDSYLWQVVKEGSYYSFVNKSSGYALDLYDGNTSNGTKIVEHSVNHTTAQKWNLLSTDTTRDYPTKNKLQGFELWISDSVPVKSGAEFLGWNTDRNGYGTMYQPGAIYNTDQAGGTVTLYAQWQQTAPADKYYKVRYNSNGGSGTMSDSTHKVNENSYLSQNRFTRSGYKFLGWSTNSYDSRPTYYDGDRIYNLSTTNGAVVNLYAIWEKESSSGGQYTVIYMGNGADGGSTPSSIHTIGQWQYLTTNGYYRSGYTFSGWAFGSSGNVVYQDGEYVSNLSKTPGATVYLYAQWTKVSSGSYYVHYDSNGGSGTMYNSSHKINEYSYLSTNQFTRSGYKFLGWSTNRYDARPTYYDGGQIYNLSTTNGATVNLYAIWESSAPTSYTITYKANGGVGNDQYQTVNAGNSWYARGAIFTRSGYTLKSWNTSPYGSGTTYGLDLYQNPLYSNLTLYAQWEQNQVSSGSYTVRYNANGGSGFMSNSVFKIDEYGYLSTNQFSRSGYKFLGWSTNRYDARPTYYDGNRIYNLSTIDGTIIDLYAIWESTGATTHTITYKANGGVGSDQYQTVNNGNSWYARGAIFTRSGYTLESWNTDPYGKGTSYGLDLYQDPLYNDLTLYAQWKANVVNQTYTVRYNGNGADGGYTPNSTHTIGQYGYLTDNAFYRDGYTFKGWATYSFGSAVFSNRAYVKDLTTTPGAIVDLYAVWEQDTPSAYTITYKSNGGTGTDQTQIVNAGNGWYARGTIFSRTNYTLDSWNTDPYGNGTKYELDGWNSSLNSNLTLYAQWKEKAPSGQYTVVYLGNGADGGSTENSVHTIGLWSYLSYNGFYRDGYEFQGWAKSSTGQVVYTDHEYVGNLTTTPGDTIYLYAVWKYNGPNSYTITYKNNGGSGSDQIQTVTAGSGWYARGEIFLRTNYTLESWNTDPNGRGTRYELDGWNSSLNSNLTLYAQWKLNAPKTYTVKYHSNGGAGTMDDSVFTINEYGYLRKNQFIRDGYTFLGWSTYRSDARPTYYDENRVYNLSTTDGSVITLYAIWEYVAPNSYSITYKPNGGAGSDHVQEVQIGQSWYARGAIFSRTDYTLESWNTDPNGRGTRYELDGWHSSLNGDLTLYAQWKQKQKAQYKIHYVSNGGSPTSNIEQIVLDGEYWMTKGNIFEKDGYTLESWNTSQTGYGVRYELNQMQDPVTADLTLFAQYKPNKYTVNYHGNGETSGSTASSVHEFDKLQNLTPNGFKKDGYIFEGWTTIPPVPATYVVKYNGNGADSGHMEDSVFEVNKNEQLRKNTYSQTGYKFMGWSTDSKATVATYNDESIVSNLAGKGGTITLYAVWEKVQATTYTVTYHSNDGGSDISISDTITAGLSWYTKDTDAFTRTGYKLVSWNTRADGLGKEYGAHIYQDPISENLHLYAQWEEEIIDKNYTVTYHSNDGTGKTHIETYKVGERWNASGENTFTRNGYRLSSWNTSSDGWGNTYNPNQEQNPISSNINLYAQWTKQVTITYHYNVPGDIRFFNQYADYGKNWTTMHSGAFQRNQYSLDSWNTDPNGNGTKYKTNSSQTPLTSNLNLYAIWIYNGYSLNNEPISEHEVFAEHSTTENQISTFALKDFYQDQEEVVNLTNVNNGVVDMYAVWRLEEYTVTYKPNGGIGTEQVQKVQPSKGWYTKDAIFTKEGYILESWNTDPNGKGDSYGLNSFSFSLDKDLVLYAQWKKNEAIEGYTVTYKPNGGNGNDFIEKIPFDSYFTPQGPIFTREKFKQVSWNTSPTGDGERYDFYTLYPKLTGNLILYAQWEEESTELPHTVTYKPNGGDGEDHIQHVDAGSGWYLRGSIFNRTDYTLESWNTRADGQGKRYELDEFQYSLNQDLVLYAQWRSNNLKEHRVTYKSNSSSGQDHVQTVSGGAAWYTRGNIFNKPGYILTSWNTNEDGSGTRYELDAFQSPLNNDLILYAQWEKEEVYGIYFSRLPSAILSNDQSKWSSDAELTSVNKNDHIVKYRVWHNTDSNNIMPDTWLNVIDDYQKTDVTLNMIINNIPTQPYDQYVHFAGQTMHGDSIVDLVLLPAIYQITYKANDENIPDQIQSVMKNESWIVKDNIFSKPGYTLESWNTEPDGSGTRFELGSVQAALTGNLTLHAQWKIIPTAPTITIGNKTKTFYEGTNVTKEDLLKDVSAKDKIEGDITDKLKVVKVEYAEGRLVDGKHKPAYIQEWQNGMQNGDTLDTWFMELDKNMSPIEHKVTFEVTNSAGLSSTAVQSVFVKYNEFPEIQAVDRYFTLEEAQSGIITDKLLREDAIKSGKVSATDQEEGDFSNTSKITLLDFDAEEFKNFTDSGYRKLTFHVQDTYGPNGKGKETLCQITVYVMKDGEIVEPEKGKVIRFIDEKYYNLNKDCDPDTMTEAEKEKANKNGGLNVYSKWYCDPEYRALLQGTFGKTSGTRYHYTLEDLNAMRSFVDIHGPGNAQEIDALSKFADQFMTGRYKK